MRMKFSSEIFFVSLLSCTGMAFASENGGHADPVAPVLVALIVILAVAKLSSEIFERLSQPAVLGELLGGVLLGNLILLNPEWNFFEPLRAPTFKSIGPW